MFNIQYGKVLLLNTSCYNDKVTKYLDEIVTPFTYNNSSSILYIITHFKEYSHFIIIDLLFVNRDYEKSNSKSDWDTSTF